ADESRVLGVGDGLHAEEEIVQMYAMDRPFVLFGVVGAHEEFAGRNQRELGCQIGRHGSRSRIAHRPSRPSRAELFDYTFRMRIETFALERFQSIWENRVAWNVSESGVHPMRVVDLVDTPAIHDALLEQE